MMSLYKCDNLSTRVMAILKSIVQVSQDGFVNGVIWLVMMCRNVLKGMCRVSLSEYISQSDLRTMFSTIMTES